MPELPEVETIVRGLSKSIVGKKIISLKTTITIEEEVAIKEVKKTAQLPSIVGGLKDKFIQSVSGAKVSGIKRRGKAIIIGLSTGYSLVVHLKMTGRLVYTDEREALLKHTHLILNLSGKKELRYVDVRRFGYIKIFKTETVFSENPLNTLGHEPADIKLEDLGKLLAGHKIRMKSFLLNQSFMAGIGNIYADEILHRSRIHPLKLSCNLNKNDILKLHRAIKGVLKEAIEHRGSTIRDYVTSDGTAGTFQKLHRVYDKEGKRCRSCKGEIIKIKVGGRSTFFCPSCQPINDK